MSETTLPNEPNNHAAPTGSDLQLDSFGILANLIVTVLAPMFLGVSGGDIHFARMAAQETVDAYRARDQSDLMAIAQIVACGLAALGSLSLSMADDLSLSMTLRLRASAVALNRVAEQNRRSLAQARYGNDAPDQTHRTDGASAPFAQQSEQSRYEAQVVAQVAATQKLTAQARVSLRNPQPTADPAPVAPSVPVQVSPLAASASSAQAVAAPAMTAEQQHALWAFAMSDVAAEFTADLKHYPPAERKLASQRAAALSSCANQLLLGNVPPLHGAQDLAAILRTNTPQSPRRV